MVGHDYELFRIGDEYTFKCSMTTSNDVIWRTCDINVDNNETCSEQTYKYEKSGMSRVSTIK